MNDCDICKLSRCFWCGEEKDELIISKRMDSKWCNNKSRSIIVNYDPCKKCEEIFAKGIHIIEAQDDPMNPNQPEIAEGIYPTGRFWVIKRGVLDDFPEDQSHVFVKENAARKMGLYDLEDKDDADNS